LTGGFFYCHFLAIIIAVDPRREGVVVEIIIRVVGPLLVVIGLFWFAHGAGLLTSPYNAATVDYGAAVVAAGFAIVWLGWQ
jgi:hypothetical protein